MAIKKISQLPAASALQNSDLLVAEQNGVAKSVTGSVLLAMLDGHGGIASTSYTAPVAPSLQGTLTLTFADGTTASIPIYNGAQGAQGAQGEQGEQGAAFTYSDFTPEQIEALRGEQGIQGVPGNPGYVHVKWSSVEPTSDSDIGDIPDAWMGIYSGSSSTAPTAYTEYAWYKIKGEQGARGFTGARGANGTKIYLSNAAPIFYDYYYYFGLSQLVSPDGQIGVSPASGDLILYRNSYYSSTGITDSLRGIRCTWGYDIVLSTATDEQVQDAVDEYLDNHPTVTGTFTNEAKNALLTLLEKLAYTIEGGQDYYDALEVALLPPADLVSISAVFEQGQTVIYDTDSLDVLRPMLTVTAHYSDSTTETVTAYTLSGTLTVGTSTITASYGDKTATFNVSVTEQPTIGSLTAGTEVTIMESNVAKPWIYLGQDSNDNCILIRKNTYATRAMNSSALTTTDYDGTSMDVWLQGDYQTRFTQALASHLSPKSITYTVYAPSDSPTSFTKTISRSVYLPSMYEMGFGGSEGGDSYLDVLKEFYNTTDAKTARIANNESGTAVHYWSRTATTQADNRFRYVRQWGDETYGVSTLNTVCTRPMMSLLPTTPINEAEGGGYVVG